MSAKNCACAIGKGVAALKRGWGLCACNKYRSLIMAFVHDFVRSLLVVLCGGLCYAAASRPLVQIEESYPDSPLVTRVQEAESRREKHPQGNQFGGERKLALDVLAPISEVDPRSR